MGLENFKANFDLESLFQHVILEAMGAQGEVLLPS